MPLINLPYSSPWWLPGGHLQTIVPALLRMVPVAYEREKLELPDGDFLNLDWGRNSQRPATDRPLVVLCHGLEGDSSRPYITGVVRLAQEQGLDCLAWNFRSCGGEMNRLPRFYHLGDTEDLRIVVQHGLAAGYSGVFAIGFSAGANMLLKYLGEEGASAKGGILAAAAISPPLDMQDASVQMESPHGMFYNRRFVGFLSDKVRKKPSLKHLWAPLESVKTLRQFDDLVTAPIHGFASADDYYDRSSSMHFLSKIEVPTMVLTAKNDPFYGPGCRPASLFAELENVFGHITVSGGHCGFAGTTLRGTSWGEQTLMQFLLKHNQ